MLLIKRCIHINCLLSPEGRRGSRARLQTPWGPCGPCKGLTDRVGAGGLLSPHTRLACFGILKAL